MIASSNQQLMSPATYLDWEARQEIRHEYIEGMAYAMAGGTIPHNAIAINLIAMLRNQLRGSACRVLGGNAKVRIAEQGPFFYPDILVTCNDHDKKSRQFIQSPCLVIEVLSQGTESYDRGAKFAQYRRLESLREYGLINSEQVGLDLFRLNERGKWELTPYTAGQSIHLTTIDFTFAIELLYEEVELL
jgi:Uma2 family endonuclease